jgi:hypothetical protein
VGVVLVRGGRHFLEDVPYVFPPLEIGVNEAIQLSILKLHRRIDVVGASQLRNRFNDTQTVLNAALVIVRHLEDGQILESLGHGCHPSSAGLVDWIDLLDWFCSFPLLPFSEACLSSFSLQLFFADR